MEGPRPPGRVRDKGKGSWRQHPGKDKISRGAGGAAGPKNRMSCRRSAPGGSARLGSGEEAGGARTWGSPPPLLAGARNCLGQKGMHPVLNPAGALGWAGGRTRGRPLVLLLLGPCAWSSDLRKYSSSNTNFLSAYHVEGCVLGAVEENRDVNERLLVSKRLPEKRGRTTLRINCSTFLSLHSIFGNLE